MKSIIKKNKTGFTLIEMIVAMGIFATVVLVTVGSLLLLVDAQRKAFSTREVYDNLRFSLESIGKDLRTGGAYHCGWDSNPLELAKAKDCPTSGLPQSSVTYTNAKGEQITYRLLSGRIEKLINSAGGPVTSNDVIIDGLSFYVDGADTTDEVHPRVTVVISAHVGSGRSRTSFILQTTITQRKVLL